MFTVGDEPDSSSGGTLIASTNGLLAIRVQDGQELVLHPTIIGTGSVTFERIGSLVSDSTFTLGESGHGAAIEASTFSGGSTLKSGVLVIGVDSAQSGGSVTAGPLGTGTFTIEGGEVQPGSGFGESRTIGNTVRVAGSGVVSGSSPLDLVGTVRFAGSGSLGHTLTYDGESALRFIDTTFVTEADAGTLAVGVDGTLQFNIGTGNTRTFVGAVGVGTASVTGIVNEVGAGRFAANHFRVSELKLEEGTLRVRTEITGTGSMVFGDADDIDAHISRVNTLSLALDGNDAPTVTLDLSNNAMIIDYDSASPLAGSLNSGVASWIKNAWASGSWNGTGITTEFGDATDIAIGYGEASVSYGISGSGTATFEQQTVDATSALIRVTRYGDATLDGIANIADFSRVSANFNQPGLWTEGDFDYDGDVDIADYALLSGNFNEQQVKRPGPNPLPPLAELYIAMLDQPPIYWESRLWTEFWNQHFAIFETMNLGPVPPVPQYLVSRGVPEPGLLAVGLAGTMLMLRRRRNDR